MINQRPSIQATHQPTEGWANRAPAPHIGTLTSNAIQLWLVEQLASRLDLEIDEIDVREKFASYGLDSRTAVEIAGELENWSGLEVEPTLVWDYPTIEAVAQHLMARQSEERSQTNSATEV